MKKIFACLFIIGNTQFLNAQWGINASYINSDITTNNVGLAVQYHLTPKHQFQLGTKYHFNDDSTQFIDRQFYQNLSSNKLSNKIGLIFEYRLNFRPNKMIQPYLFYNFQFIRSETKFIDTSSYIDSLTKKYYSSIPDSLVTTYREVNFFENHVGAGININFNQHLAIYAGVCVGGTFISNIPDLDDINAGRTNYGFLYSSTSEFSWLFNTGISYIFGEERKKSKKSKSKKL